LFGPYAYGQPTVDSDVDLMIVMPHREASPKVAARIRLACSHHFPMDLLVRSPSELRRRLKLGDSFNQEVISRGVILHEADNTRMAGKSRSGFRRRAAAPAVPQKT
jgi:predicted nucleotidyltransferase